MKLRTLTMQTRPLRRGLAAHRLASLGLRVRAKLHRHALDRALAAGCPPSTGADRAFRASQLTHPSTRRVLARSLRRAVADSSSPDSAVLSSAIAPKPRAAWGWQEALLGIADRLEQPGPINPCGVARVRLLLTDGTGPLYNPGAGEPLSDAIWSVADGLRLCSPHEWDSPKVMKLDPERVAWTCRRCGAIATSHDVAVRPA